MIMIKRLITICSLFLFLNAGAQNNSLILEKWETSPVLHTIDSKYEGESAVILLDKS